MIKEQEGMLTVLHPYGKLIIGLSKDRMVWTITSWFVDERCQKQGIGTKLMREAVEYLTTEYGVPEYIDYVWNGAKPYVGKWLEKFDAECKAPLAMLKYEAADCWEAHEYALNVEKFVGEMLKDVD